MDTIPSGLKFAVGMLLTLFVISAIVSIYFVANGYFDRAQEQTTAQSQVLNSAEYSIYDNRDVAGQEVRNAVTRYAGRLQFAVHIKTGVNPSGFFAKNNYSTCFATPATTGGLVDVNSNSCSTAQIAPQTMQDASSSNYYVNPSGIFSANIYRDANNEVRLIEFTQKR